MVKLEKIAFAGWKNCYRLSNGIVDLVLTTDVGPRIIRFGFEKDDNEFTIFDDTAGETGGDEWRPYGGHRLWHAPESKLRTYYPDNWPVTFEEKEDHIRLVQEPEPTTGIQKEIHIRLYPKDPFVIVTHRMRNTNLWAVQLAIWAISIMAPGGKAIIPLPPRGPHEKNLQPTGSIALWAYTNMADPRWVWGEKYLMLRHDPKAETPQKLGVMVPDGWLAHYRNGHLLIKEYTFFKGAQYTDRDSCVELFADAEKLELETLGPLVRLNPGGEVEHLERWFLYKDIPELECDEDVDKHVLQLVRSAVWRSR